MHVLYHVGCVAFKLRFRETCTQHTHTYYVICRSRSSPDVWCGMYWRGGCLAIASTYSSTTGDGNSAICTYANCNHLLCEYCSQWCCSLLLWTLQAAAAAAAIMPKRRPRILSHVLLHVRYPQQIWYFRFPLMNFFHVNVEYRRRVFCTAVLCVCVCLFRVCVCLSAYVCLGDGALEEVEKLELKTEVEGNLKKQSKTKPGKGKHITTPHHTITRASNLFPH